ncbi:RICIN domain-containing protein [Kitasatospora sp. NPDC057904]|uniref:RICIN domain-containing protein n=1 Tax=Kitasatospora sp. NPDC057904 TaxID=3346275 RepID=UPI0036D9018D
MSMSRITLAAIATAGVLGLTAAGPATTTAYAASSAQNGPAAKAPTHSTNTSENRARRIVARYLNLHQCTYKYTNGKMYTTVVPTTPFSAGTNVSGAADTQLSCTAGTGGWQLDPGNSAVKPLDLTTGQYLNLHQCTYKYTDGTMYTTVMPNTPFSTGTNVSNTQDTQLSCAAGTGGWQLDPGNSAVKPLDLDSGQYLNLHQCVYKYTDGTMYTTVMPNTPFGTGTNVSNTKDTQPSCAAGTGGWQLDPGNSGVFTAELSTTDSDNLFINRMDGSRMALGMDATGAGAQAISLRSPGWVYQTRKWTVITKRSGYQVIRNDAANLCLQPVNASPAAGNAIVVQPCNGSAAQDWDTRPEQSNYAGTSGWSAYRPRTNPSLAITLQTYQGSGSWDSLYLDTDQNSADRLWRFQKEGTSW